MEVCDAKMVDSKLVQVLPWLLVRDACANLSRCSDEDGDSMVVVLSAGFR